jgi:hypothetical protein
MTIRLADKARMPSPARCGAARVAWLVYAAWSTSRGSHALQKALAGWLQHAAVLAIGFFFPVSSGRKAPLGWKMQSAAVPVLSRAHSLRRSER